MLRKIKTALISVSDKTGVVRLCQVLARHGVKILSTGGTARLLRDNGLDVVDVSEHTGFPEILDGRVKTLHPRIHGGILGRRDLESHREAMSEHGIEDIDMVVVNLYPFEDTISRGAPYAEAIENIDIGGPAMIRSAAKNHEDVTIVVSPDNYDDIIEELDNNSGATTLELRKRLALTAYSRTAAYDAAISNWLASQLEIDSPASQFNLIAQLKQSLRYGENPHQKAAFYSLGEQAGTLAGATQLQGKELSYNNINDTDAALELVQEFDKPAVAIIKHANPCGVAIGCSPLDAYKKAFECDPQSAFGGIIALNGEIDIAVAEAISEQFAEVIIAPSISDEAKEVFVKKKNLRVLITGSKAAGEPSTGNEKWQVKTVSGGILVQQRDSKVFDGELQIVSKRRPSDSELEDMKFAFTVAKHVKSNAIVLAKDGRTIGIGAGQMSRVDSVRISCLKAGEAGLSTEGAVLASDAFFPFDDNVHLAADSGIAALIQPGGSIRDEEVIKAADKHNMVMALTGIRHFKH